MNNERGDAFEGHLWDSMICYAEITKKLEKIHN